jgi:hypothetical protein
MSLTERFKEKDLGVIQAAFNGDFLLDVKNPKLYKKLVRYVQNEYGASLDGEPWADYEIIMNTLSVELEPMSK